MRLYHYNEKTKPYFEGWYFKHQNNDATIAFIPGIQIDSKGNKSAFIQVITNKVSYNVNYPFESFNACKEDLYIRIGNNVFSNKGLELDIKDDNFYCKASLKYSALSYVNKNCMGIFRYYPFMECNHMVISMKHSIEGKIRILLRDEETIIYFGRGSTGYIEKDWGSSFPRRYAWTQCNRFVQHDCSIMATAAIIPFLKTEFLGTTCIILYLGQYHILATFLGAKVKSFTENKMVIYQGKKRLEVNIIQNSYKPLNAPDKGSMNRVIHESCECKARYLYTIDDKVIFDYKSDQASFEYERSY